METCSWEQRFDDIEHTICSYILFQKYWKMNHVKWNEALLKESNVLIIEVRLLDFGLEIGTWIWEFGVGLGLDNSYDLTKLVMQ